MRDAARSGPLAAAGGLLLRPALGGLRREMDPDATGGAILLGLRGVAVVGHGSSGPEGIANAIRLADRAVRERAVERTGRAARRGDPARRRASDAHQRDRQRMSAMNRDEVIFARSATTSPTELEVDADRDQPTTTRFREDLDADSLDLYELVMELEDTLRRSR